MSELRRALGAAAGGSGRGVGGSAQLVTACLCYGGPVTCAMVEHRGMTIDRCKTAID